MLPLLPFERIAKKSGVKRITASAVAELRDIIEDDAVKLSDQAVRLSKHAGRRTVTAEDIKFASDK